MSSHGSPRGNSPQRVRAPLAPRSRREGEVYRARDTKLGRDVAIKVLPEALAQDAERIERIRRFEREGKLLAQLNHPGIATLHGLGEDRGRLLLVMELVEGENWFDELERIAPR